MLLSLLSSLLGCGLGTSKDIGPRAQALCDLAATGVPLEVDGKNLVQFDAPPIALTEAPRLLLPRDLPLDAPALARLGPPSDGVVEVWIESTTETAALITALQTLHGAGFTRPLLLGASQKQVEAPPFAEPVLGERLQAELGHSDPAMRAILLSKELQSALAWCPGAVSTLSAVANADPNQKCTFLAQGLAESLPSCPFTRGDRVLTLLQVAVLPDDLVLPAAIPLNLNPAGRAWVVSAETSPTELLSGLARQQPPPVWIALKEAPAL